MSRRNRAIVQDCTRADKDCARRSCLLHSEPSRVVIFPVEKASDVLEDRIARILFESRALKGRFDPMWGRGDPFVDARNEVSNPEWFHWGRFLRSNRLRVRHSLTIDASCHGLRLFGPGIARGDVPRT